MIRHAALAMKEHRQKVGQGILKSKRDPGKVKDAGMKLQLTLHDVLTNGWPKQDEEIGHLLDLLFEGEWVKEARKAAELPLGMVEDPLLASSDQENASTGVNFVSLAQLFSGRAFNCKPGVTPEARSVIWTQPWHWPGR